MDDGPSLAAPRARWGYTRVNAGGHERVKKLFLELCDADEATRRTTLDRECAGDPTLRAEVESLLAHHSPQTILETAGSRTTLEVTEKPSRLATLRPLARQVRASAARHRWPEARRRKRPSAGPGRACG